MAKVIVERSRANRSWAAGGGSEYPRGYLRNRVGDLDEAPTREAMGSSRYRTKMLNENLAPLVRYLRAHVGHLWVDVYSDICERISVRSAVQKHIVDHLRDFVSTSTFAVGEEQMMTNRYGTPQSFPIHRRDQFYVCPHTGVLREVPWRKRVHGPPPDPNVVAIDDHSEHRRIAGVWYYVELGVSGAGRVFDVVQKKMVQVAGVRYARTKRQLSTREVAEVGRVRVRAIDVPATSQKAWSRPQRTSAHGR